MRRCVLCCSMKRKRLPFQLAMVARRSCRLLPLFYVSRPSCGPPSPSVDKQSVPVHPGSNVATSPAFWSQRLEHALPRLLRRRPLSAPAPVAIFDDYLASFQDLTVKLPRLFQDEQALNAQLQVDCGDFRHRVLQLQAEHKQLSKDDKKRFRSAWRSQ